MKSIKDLNLGFSDAQIYAQRGNKQMLAEIFVKNIYLSTLLKDNIYYLIGEKGTGKTAYAVYLSNNENSDAKSSLKFIDGTDYERFHELKKHNKLDVSGYIDIWKTILLLLMAKGIIDDKKMVPLFDKSKLLKLKQAIDEYYNKAFSPEIENALKIIDDSGVFAKMVFQHVEAGIKKDSTVEFTEQRMQMNLFYICKQFSECLGSIKLTKNYILFIDGIDVRPDQIPYKDYLECIKGLAKACWTLNTGLFANVRDSKGQFRIVLLLRPDIFNSLSLQNSTNKLADNSVYLEWRTTYADYPTSYLYEMSNKLLMYSQNDQDKKVKNIWEKYFDWKIKNSAAEPREYDTAFMQFLDISLSRPRDIQRILSLIKSIMLERGLGDQDKFSYNVFDSDNFQNQYSEYFLSSLKDQLSFYYSEDDFNHFRRFFDYFSSPKFTYQDYHNAYLKFVEYILEYAKDIPQFVEDEKLFLQLLYDSNVITAIEDNEGKFFHVSYREKSPSNIAPHVPIGKNILYRFHLGLYKKAKLGRYRKA